MKESQPSMGSILNKQTEEAHETIKKGQDKLEEIKTFVSEHLDELLKEASSDYKEQIKVKIQEALESGRYSKAQSLLKEIENHTGQIDQDLRDANRSLVNELEHKLDVNDIGIHGKGDFFSNGNTFATRNDEGHHRVLINKEGRIISEDFHVLHLFGEKENGVLLGFKDEAKEEKGRGQMLDFDGKVLIDKIDEVEGNETETTEYKLQKEGRWYPFVIENGKVEIKV